MQAALMLARDQTERFTVVSATVDSKDTLYKCGERKVM